MKKKRRATLNHAFLVSIALCLCFNFQVHLWIASRLTSLRHPKGMNVLILYGDDWRHDAMSVAGSPVETPFLDRLARQGVRFTHACVVTSVCWISRATFHTGQYLSRHKSNDFLVPKWYSQWNSTFPFLLRTKGGYHVGHVGKWHYEGWNDLMKANYDWFRVYEGKHWYDMGGSRVHTTKRNKIDALTFLKERPKHKPFLLTVSFFAPHAVDASDEQYYPMPRSMSLYRNLTLQPPPDTFHELPSFFTEENIGRRRWRMRFETPQKFDVSLKNYYRLISEVDSACERIFEELRTQGVLDKTLVIFTTDNGYFHAEHGLADKWYPHEESIRVPLIVHDPRMPSTHQGSVRDEFVLNVDLAPTIIGAAGLTSPDSMQGRDFSELYLGQDALSWRKDFFYEHPTIQSPHAIPASSAVVEKDLKYIYWPDWNVEQLFDLQTDPKETRDVSNIPEYAIKLDELRRRHEILRQAVV